MTIGATSPSRNTASVSSQHSSHTNEAASISNTSSGSKKDSLTISEAARNLAALKTGESSQEEAAESVSTELNEQISGTE